MTAAVIFLAACGIGGGPDLKLDPESRDFYESARLVMTDAERDIFTHLPDAESRREFIKEFWEKRDPDLTTEVNEFKEEFESRIQYANQRFREGRKGINTDRGRIYVYLGPPDKVEDFPYVEGSRGSALWWIYYRYELGIEFVDETGTGGYNISQIEGNLFEAMEMAKLGETFTQEGMPAKFINFNLKYNKDKKEFSLSIPVKKLSFKEEDGLLNAAFDFEFFVYKGSGAQREKFTESRLFQGKPEELEKSKEITFVFRHELPPGKNYVDVILNGKEENGKSRKIFNIKI